MDQNSKKKIQMAMYRRWLYMGIAIIASALLYLRPVLTFREDVGIVYIRTYRMDEKKMEVIHTELANGRQRVVATMSVKGLYYTHLAMMIGTILCVLCLDFRSARMVVCAVTAGAAGLYYILVVIYAVRMSDLHFATMYPNIMSVLPAVVLEMMLLTRQTIIRTIFIENDAEEEQEEEKAE